MPENMIHVENLSKRYQIGVLTRHDTLRDQITAGFKRLLRRASSSAAAPTTFWALEDISFDVRQGDVVGIIGKNGAGKSTLLKILSRITKPTRGRALINGRVGSLLEVGTGFHPELTGRENIYLNGAILGMTKAEIDHKLSEIIAFAEVEKFIETPVKRYSSGMYVRLAFAVAAHLEPEVLIIDEVLAVGDVAFQKKCLAKVGEVAGQGRTVLFVSHNMAAVQHLCNSVIVLQDGRMVFSGSPEKGIAYYVNDMAAEREETSHIIDLREAPGRQPTYRQSLTRLELYTDDDTPVNGYLQVGEPLRIAVSFQLENTTPNFNVTLIFENSLGQRILDVSSFYHHFEFAPEEQLPGEHTFVCDIPNFTLLPGQYSITAFVDVDGINIDRVERAARLSLIEADYYGGGKLPKYGYMVIKHQWDHIVDSRMVSTQSGDGWPITE